MTDVWVVKDDTGKPQAGGVSTESENQAWSNIEYFGSERSDLKLKGYTVEQMKLCDADREKELVAMAIGWAYADCCVALDEGRDPREHEMPEVLQRALSDLELEAIEKDKGE